MIDKYAFEGMSFDSFVCEIKQPLSISPDVFLRTDLQNSTLYVPVGSVDAYKSADVWKDSGNIKEIDATSVQNVSSEGNAADATYNLRGQKVDGNYRGVVIKNGSKRIQK